ncbi:MAG: hypothetical protein EBY23_10730 [Actinobacteria bacterium]|nr:hypothetical protein [Actinomycetota bacterium]
MSIMRKPDDLRTPVLDIVPMRRKHLKAIMPIEEVVYPRPWTLGVFHAEIELVRREQRFYIVGQIGEEVVGYGGLLFTPDDAHECQALTLEVRMSNTPAQELYRRFGFVPAGVRKKYYENVEDAMVMWCHEVSSFEYGARLREIETERGNAHR